MLIVRKPHLDMEGENSEEERADSPDGLSSAYDLLSRLTSEDKETHPKTVVIPVIDISRINDEPWDIAQVYHCR